LTTVHYILQYICLFLYLLFNYPNKQKILANHTEISWISYETRKFMILQCDSDMIYSNTSYPNHRRKIRKYDLNVVCFWSMSLVWLFWWTWYVLHSLKNNRTLFWYESLTLNAKSLRFWYDFFTLYLNAIWVTYNLFTHPLEVLIFIWFVNIVLIDCVILITSRVYY
jgi:hypothetical protein